MRVNTRPYGIIDIDERQKIYFSKGILGFENMKDYVLMDAAQQPFYWLQSLDIPEIAFVLINPVIFQPDYNPGISAPEFEEIDLSDVDDNNTLVFAIVTIPEDYQKMTANLQGPIIINREKRIGRQFISPNTEWKIHHYILEELSGVRNKSC